MSGGLRHHNDEENGPSHAVGYKSSKKQDSYSLERNQCVCAVEEVCPDLQKPEPKSLDRTGVVRDVVTSITLKTTRCQTIPILFPARESSSAPTSMSLSGSSCTNSQT